MFFLLYDFFPSQLWKLQVVSQSCTTTGICLFKVHNETMEQWNKSTLEQRCWQCLYCWYWTDFSNVLVFYQLTVNVLPVNSRFFDKQSIICFFDKRQRSMKKYFHTFSYWNEVFRKTVLREISQKSYETWSICLETFF